MSHVKPELQKSNLRKVDDSWDILMITDLDKLVRLSFFCVGAGNDDLPNRFSQVVLLSKH